MQNQNNMRNELILLFLYRLYWELVMSNLEKLRLFNELKNLLLTQSFEVLKNCFN